MVNGGRSPKEPRPRNLNGKSNDKYSNQTRSKSKLLLHIQSKPSLVVHISQLAEMANTKLDATAILRYGQVHLVYLETFLRRLTLHVGVL